MGRKKKCQPEEGEAEEDLCGKADKYGFGGPPSTTKKAPKIQPEPK